ncbi:hypothetical protein GGG16DRAFT_117236 [Schizophyllum commune]
MSGLVMKTWFGTDPSTTQPQVQHNNPRSAARAAAVQKKKQQQPETAQNTNNYRVIHPPSPRGDAQLQAMAPPPIPSHATPLPARRMNRGEVQVSRVIGKRATDTRDVDAESSTASTSTSKGNGQGFLNASTSAGYIGSRPSSSYPTHATQATHTIQPPIATDGRPAQRVRLDPLVSSGLLNPALLESSNIQNVSQSRPMQEDSPTNLTEVESEYNVGWRRFGPMGRNIAEYSPRIPDTPTVEWPSQLTTVTPYIPGIRIGDPELEINVLQRGQTYVENAAKKFKSSRDRPYLCMHVPFTTEREAIRLIRDCMAKGIPLVFDDFPDSLRWAHKGRTDDDDPFMDPIRWSDDPVDGVDGVDLYSPRAFQHAVMPTADKPSALTTSTLIDFKQSLKSPFVARYTSELMCGFPQDDHLTDRISDNLVASRTKSFGTGYGGHHTILADMMSQDWFFLSTAGCLMVGQLDAYGLATSAQIRGSGLQERIIFSSRALPPAPAPHATREERRALQAQLLDDMLDLIYASKTPKLITRTDAIKARRRKAEAKALRGEGARRAENVALARGVSEQDTTASRSAPSSDAILDKVDGCILELRPGMKYFQPTGTVNATYAPFPTAATGKRFFTFGDLHRVELLRRIQMRKGTHADHKHNCGVQLMLISMAASLPARAAGGQVFHRKPMIALALMLTRPKGYIAAPEPLHALEKDEDAWSATKRKDKERMCRENAERDAEYQMTRRLRSKRWAKDGTSFHKLAFSVACKILHACAHKYEGDEEVELPGPEYIMEGSRWDDPGPPLDVKMYFDDYLKIPPEGLWGRRGRSKRRIFVRSSRDVVPDVSDTDSDSSESSSSEDSDSD